MATYFPAPDHWNKKHMLGYNKTITLNLKHPDRNSAHQETTPQCTYTYPGILVHYAYRIEYNYFCSVSIAPTFSHSDTTQVTSPWKSLPLQTQWVWIL